MGCKTSWWAGSLPRGSESKNGGKERREGLSPVEQKALNDRRENGTSGSSIQLDSPGVIREWMQVTKYWREKKKKNLTGLARLVSRNPWVRVDSRETLEDLQHGSDMARSVPERNDPGFGVNKKGSRMKLGASE